MSNEGETRKTNLFHFQWGRFDSGAGLKYAIGILMVWWLMDTYGFISFVAGISTLLAWLTDVPGRRRDRVLGMVAYGVLGLPITLLGVELVNSPWLLISATFIVTFVGTLPMAKGPRPFMIGWVLIFWFLLVPLFATTEDLIGIVVSFLLGAGVVILLTLLGAILERWRGVTKDSPAGNEAVQEHPDMNFVVGYAVTLACTMAVTLFTGWQTLESDPTLVAQAAFFVIGPNSRQSWINGVERAIAVLLGIGIGLFLFQFVEGTSLYVPLVALICFFTLALMNVNYGAFMFFFIVFMAFWWAESGVEKAYFIATERIAAELMAIVIACAAVALLQWWGKLQKERHHVRSRQSGL